MNLKQTAKLNSFNTLVAVLNDFNSVWSANTVVGNAITNLLAYLNTLMLADGVKLTGSKGYTNAKNLAREALITFALNHAKAGRAYFVANNLPLEKQICLLSKTTLVRTKDAELLALCTNIYNAVQPYIGGMALYGATAASLSTFNTAMNNYHGLLGTPQAQRSAMVSASLTIEQQLSNIRELLDDTIDPLMAQYGSNTDFMQQYDAARHSGVMNVHHWLIISGMVTDVSNNPLRYAVVRIIGKDNHKKITTDNGKYRFIHLPMGSYSIEVALSGYKTQTAIVTADVAQTLQQNFVMVAV